MNTKILKRIKEKGMTIPEFCRAANLYPSAAYPIVKGERPSGERVRERITKALGAENEQLFDSNGWPLEIKEGRES